MSPPYEHHSALPPGVSLTPSRGAKPAGQERKTTKKAVPDANTRSLSASVTRAAMDVELLVRKGWTDEAADVLPELRRYIDQLEQALKPKA